MPEPSDTEVRMIAALEQLGAPIPSTKGMDPRARAQRLHAEMERRIRIAREALRPQVADA